ncbi:MAG TPA: glycosyltransferase [Gemmataceae bacterium]|nr:glycosyltransferase [Gemmataceae bacterium]
MTRHHAGRVSVVTPVRDADPKALTACVESVRAQDYYNWELCLCDDGSADPGTLAVLKRYRGVDTRIKVHLPGPALGYAGASNAAAEFATGEFLAFLAPDDTLAPSALGAVARAAAAHDDADLLYTDEDRLGAGGSACDARRKPDWSPASLSSATDPGRLLVVRKVLFLELGGFRAGCAGAEDHDLTQRAAGRARRVAHLPQVLYHRQGGGVVRV